MLHRIRQKNSRDKRNISETSSSRSVFTSLFPPNSDHAMNHFAMNHFETRTIVKLKYLPSNTPAALHKLITPSSGVHNYNTRYASKENLYRPVSRTNYGLSRFSSMASRVWEKVPYRLKILPFSSFIQQYKHHLLVNQN